MYLLAFFCRVLPHHSSSRAADSEDAGASSSRSKFSDLAGGATKCTLRESGRAALDFSTTGWKSLATARLSCAFFNVGTMLKYFLDSDGGDGQSAQNFKAVSSTASKALRLYQRGYVQKIEVVRVEDIACYKARYEPEMKTKSQYKLELCVSIVGGDGEMPSCSILCSMQNVPDLQARLPKRHASTWLYSCMPLKIFVDMATLET